MEDVNGKGAFVTGGASGIGLGMTRAFLKAGMRVAIGDLQKDRIENAISGLRTQFSEEDVLPIELDVQERSGLEDAANQIEARFGKVHVLCNNAGIGAGGPLHTVSPELWEKVISINLTSVFNGIQVFVPRMQKHGEGGHIVSTASMTGVIPIGGSGPYGVAKAGVAVMSEILRQDLEEEKISASVLAPWIVNTPIFRPHVDEKDQEAMVAHQQTMEQRWGDSLTDPDDVGQMVLDGIINDELYIFNDPVARNMLEHRIKGMYDALDRQFD